MYKNKIVFKEFFPRPFAVFDIAKIYLQFYSLNRYLEDIY